MMQLLVLLVSLPEYIVSHMKTRGPGVEILHIIRGRRVSRLPRASRLESCLDIRFQYPFVCGSVSFLYLINSLPHARIPQTL